MTASVMSPFVDPSSTVSIVQPSNAKSRIMSSRPPTTSTRRGQHGLRQHGVTTDDMHVATAFNDREIQRRLQAVEDAADCCDDTVAAPTSSLPLVFRGREATNLGNATTTALFGAVPPLAGWCGQRVGAVGRKHKSPSVTAPVGGRRIGSSGIVDGAGTITSNVDNVLPWPVVAVGTVDQVIRVATKRSGGTNQLERRETVTARSSDCSQTSPVNGPTGTMVVGGAARLCTCAHDRGNSQHQHQQQSIQQLMQSFRAEIPFDFRHWNDVLDHNEIADAANCSDERSASRRQYIDQYRTDYTYGYVIRDYEQEALQSNCTSAGGASQSCGPVKHVPVGDEGYQTSRQRRVKQYTNPTQPSVGNSNQSTPSWNVDTSVVASSTVANGDCDPDPDNATASIPTVNVSKRAQSEPGFFRHRPSYSLAGTVSDNGGAVHYQQRSAPPAIITQVHFVHRKINVPSVADPDENDSSAFRTTTIGCESVEELEMNIGRRQSRMKQPLVGTSSKVICPTLATKNSTSCSSLPVKVYPEPQGASSSMTSSGTSTTASISLPRVTGGSYSGSNVVPHTGHKIRTTTSDATMAEEANSGCTAVPGHQLLVTFSGKTMKPIPSNGISVERGVARHHSSSTAVPSDGLRTLDLLVHLSYPDKWQAAHNEVNEVRHMMWFGSLCVDCAHSNINVVTDKHCCAPLMNRDARLATTL